MTEVFTLPALDAQLRDFMHRSLGQGGSQAGPTIEHEFGRLALDVFKLQVQLNRPYRDFCESRQARPAAIADWRAIPAMPAAGFKELDLTCLPSGRYSRVFHSSGTTGQKPSRHLHGVESLALYESSLLHWFNWRLPAFRHMSLLFLTPPPEAAPHSSLVHMFETIRRDQPAALSVFAGKAGSDGAWSLDFSAAIQALEQATEANRPVILLGTAFNFVHFLDLLVETGRQFSLPCDSAVMETGGYKSQSRALPREELHGLIVGTLGVPASRIICEYGMSELSSQAYAVSAEGELSARRVFRFPPWTKAQVINPETGHEVLEGGTGLIRILDLANLYSVMAVQTEDLGIRRADGFELLGRAVPAESRGCSLMSH